MTRTRTVKKAVCSFGQLPFCADCLHGKNTYSRPCSFFQRARNSSCSWSESCWEYGSFPAARQQKSIRTCNAKNKMISNICKQQNCDYCCAQNQHSPHCRRAFFCFQMRLRSVRTNWLTYFLMLFVIRCVSTSPQHVFPGFLFLCRSGYHFHSLSITGTGTIFQLLL